MSNITPMNRDMKKRQLKRQIVPTPSRNTEKEETSEEIVKKAHKKVWKKRFLILFLVLLLLSAAAFGAYRYYRDHQYTDYTIGWERELEHGAAGFTGYINFGNNIIKYTKDGASYIDVNGKDVWIQSYEMKSPIASVNGDFAVIADQQGNSIYIFDKNGCQGIATTLRPIIKASISAKGVVAAILEDQKVNYINMFKKDGSVLDIEIKGLLGGGVGYPLDISMSPDGTKLISSFMYIKNGMLKSRVAFYDFSEIGKNTPTRLVGGFHDLYESSMIPRVRFLDDTYSCAFADDSISFFSSRNAVSPELLVHIPIEEEIKSVFYSSQYAGVIVENPTGEYDYRMDVYKANGDKKFSEYFSYDYQYADIDGETIFLYNEDSCRVYNTWGNLKYEGSFDTPIAKVTCGSLPNSMIVTGPQDIKEIKLQ